MKYWGVSLVPEDSTLPAGVVCVKLGVIYTTAAGISEPRHFARPFWLTWGEILASGNLGRHVLRLQQPEPMLRPDPVCAVVRAAVGLRPSRSDRLRVPRHLRRSGIQFLRREATLGVRLEVTEPHGRRLWRPDGTHAVDSPYGPGTSDLHLARDWGDGVADLDFTVRVRQPAAGRLHRTGHGNDHDATCCSTVPSPGAST